MVSDHKCVCSVSEVPTQFAVPDMKPFEDALRMIRHSKWWEDHTSHLKR